MFNNNTSYKSYYFKKLSLPITKLEKYNLENSYDHDMNIELSDSMLSKETSFTLDNTSVSTVSEGLSENAENINHSKQGSDLTDTDLGNQKINTVLKTIEGITCLNKRTSMMSLSNNFLDSTENPSIMYHLETDEKDHNVNNTNYSYSSDDSEDLHKYSNFRKVYFTNSKYKCKHDMNAEHNKCKLPRQFQHHIITDVDKQNYENVLPFIQTSLGVENQDLLVKSKVYKNFKCPKTACLEEEYKGVSIDNIPKNKRLCSKIDQIILKDGNEFDKHEKKNLLNLITWRYSRRLTFLKKTTKFTKETYEETEYMCRLCKGKNWINNTVYFKHLFEEHGITTSLKLKTPFPHSIDIDSSLMIDCIQKKHINRDLLKYVRVRLLPLPLRMFVDFKKNHSGARYFMQCGICFKYIKTGTEENTSFSKFFKDHMLDSQCIYFNDPCYILGY